jgi:hypothetical protein
MELAVHPEPQSFAQGCLLDGDNPRILSNSLWSLNCNLSSKWFWLDELLEHGRRKFRDWVPADRGKGRKLRISNQRFGAFAFCV